MGEIQAILRHHEKVVHHSFGSRQSDESPGYGSAANELFKRERGENSRSFQPSDAVRRGRIEGEGVGRVDGLNVSGQTGVSTF